MLKPGVKPREQGPNLFPALKGRDTPEASCLQIGPKSQGGEACLSPLRAIKAEPIPRCGTNAKRRAAGPL
jgi:hypothetical protein